MHNSLEKNQNPFSSLKNPLLKPKDLQFRILQNGQFTILYQRRIEVSDKHLGQRTSQQLKAFSCKFLHVTCLQEAWIPLRKFFKALIQRHLYLTFQLCVYSTLNMYNPDNLLKIYSNTNSIFLFTAQNMKFSIKDFFSKCDQICRKVQIWSHLLKKSLMENFIFFAVFHANATLIYLKYCFINHYNIFAEY